MDAILINSRYKVTHVLYAQTDFAAVLAVDIESREKTEYLLNVYENDLKRQYVSCFSALKFCPEFVRMFISEGVLVAVFRAVEGDDIDSVFYKGADIPWDERLRYAQLVMHLALSVSDYPHEVGCAALLSRNLLVFRSTERIAVNYAVLPLDGMNARELVFLLGDQIEKILIKRFSSADAEIEFVQALKSGAYKSVPPLYSFWMEAQKEIRAQYERIYKKSALTRSLYLVFLNIRRWFRRTFRRNAPKKRKGAKA